jgi:DNA-binding CsgD family transcriptional regulator
MDRLLDRYHEARALLAGELASPRAAATEEGIGLAVEYGTIAVLAADFPAARPLLAGAVAQAERCGSRIGAAHALAVTALGEAYEGNTAAAGRAAGAAAALIDAMSDGELSGQPECVSQLSWAEMFLERYPDAERHLTRGVSLVRHIGHYHVLPHLLLGLCQLTGWNGPLDRSIELSEQAEEVAKHINSADVLGLALGMRAFALAWRGGAEDAKRALALAEEAVAVTPAACVWWAKTAATFHAVTLLLTGDPERCLRVLLGAGGGPGLPLIQPSLRPACYDLLTGASMMAGDNDRARDWSGRAEAASRRLGLAGQQGFARRSRAFLLSAQGRHAEAASLFAEAARQYAAAGIRVGQAWTLVFGAPSALAAGRPQQALEMATQARALADTVGSRLIGAAAEGIRQQLATAAPGPAQASGPLAALTAREREIAELAATGRTSREIAAQLSLSPRTVDTHLSRIYRKLGLSSRAALASLVTGAAAPAPSGSR